MATPPSSGSSTNNDGNTTGQPTVIHSQFGLEEEAEEEEEDQGHAAPEHDNDYDDNDDDDDSTEVEKIQSIADSADPEDPTVGGLIYVIKTEELFPDNQLRTTTIVTDFGFTDKAIHYALTIDSIVKLMQLVVQWHINRSIKKSGLTAGWIMLELESVTGLDMPIWLDMRRLESFTLEDFFAKIAGELGSADHFSLDDLVQLKVMLVPDEGYGINNINPN